MIKNSLVSFAVASLFLPGVATATDWNVVDDTSSLTFTATQSGSEFTGQLKKFTADISFDPENLASSSVAVQIDMTSVDTNSGDRDGQLPTAAWFDSGSFASAEFKSASITHTEDNAYEATGKLTIKGVSKDVNLPFTVDISGEKAVAKGSLDLSRLDYGIGTGDWANESMIGFGVSISFIIDATKVN